MPTVHEISRFLEQLAPLELAEEWDNVGLLLGDAERDVSSVMTCLTVTPDTVSEAIAAGVGLLVSHHPMPFRPLARLTTHTSAGNLLWQLASHGVSVYSLHTAWDSAECGVNSMLADKLGLENVSPLVPSEISTAGRIGTGRIGRLLRPTTLTEVEELLHRQLPHCRLRWVGQRSAVTTVAIACGSGGSLLPHAIRQKCDLFLTGEATFHNCLEAEAAGMAMVMTGHFASERFSVETLAELLAKEFAGLKVWASTVELDPVRSQA